jgi:hypothetical protein
MSIIEWPCGATTIVGALPLGLREPTEQEQADHLCVCRPCNVRGGADQ